MRGTRNKDNIDVDVEDTVDVEDLLRLLLSRIDELEGNKTKLQMRLQEAEETIDSLHTKVTLIVIRKLDRHDKEDGFGIFFSSGKMTLS